MVAKDPCFGITSDGSEYREFSCVYPSLDPFYLRYDHMRSMHSVDAALDGVIFASRKKFSPRCSRDKMSACFGTTAMPS